MSTIREVAARAGVSVTTVSRTLNNRGYISQKMRERISKAMAELNYQPNEVARSLSFQHTKMIGVLVPEIDNPFFSRIVSLLSRQLTGRGYKMLLYVASGTDDDAPDYINMLKSNQVDGIIIALCSKNIDHELLGGMPAVSFERLPSGKFGTNALGEGVAIIEALHAGCPGHGDAVAGDDFGHRFATHGNGLVVGVLQRGVDQDAGQAPVFAVPPESQNVLVRRDER